MDRVVTLERVYPYPLERVWYALTNQGALACWLMENDFEPRLGHQFQLRSLPELEIVIYCEVIALEVPTRLVYTWREQWMDQPSLVTWTLETVEAGTRLHLCHSGLNTARASRELVNLADLWQAQVRHESQTMAQPLSSSVQCKLFSPSMMTGLASFTFDFETEWEYRLAQLAKKMSRG